MESYKLFKTYKNIMQRIKISSTLTSYNRCMFLKNL